MMEVWIATENKKDLSFKIIGVFNDLNSAKTICERQYYLNALHHWEKLKWRKGMEQEDTQVFQSEYYFSVKSHVVQKVKLV